MNKKLSVIIPVFNEEESIKKCLGSLLDQTLLADEIIVVDDGSTDSTEKIVKEFPVSFFKRDHQGPGAARNFGASKAIGSILIFVDADMTFDKKFIEKLTTPILSGQAKGVFNSAEYVSNFDNVWAKCWNYNQNLYSNERLNPKSREDTEDFRAIQKSEFDRVGGFSLTGYTDSRTLVQKLGYRPTAVEGAVSYHANPATLNEVFLQSRWIGKRKTKLGILGQVINLGRYSLPFSILSGITKSCFTREPRFLIFKVIFDFGFEVGILSSLAGINTAK